MRRRRSGELFILDESKEKRRIIESTPDHRRFDGDHDLGYHRRVDLDATQSSGEVGFPDHYVFRHQLTVTSSHVVEFIAFRCRRRPSGGREIIFMFLSVQQMSDHRPGQRLRGRYSQMYNVLRRLFGTGFQQYLLPRVHTVVPAFTPQDHWIQ